MQYLSLYIGMCRAVEDTFRRSGALKVGVDPTSTGVLVPIYRTVLFPAYIVEENSCI